jgi:signal transduction histidine kinase
VRSIRPPSDPSEALLWRTRVRLAWVTLVMVATLVIVIGGVTAAVAITLMRDSIDRALDAAIADPITLHELFDREESWAYAGPLGVADTFVMIVDANGRVYESTTGAALSDLPDVAAIAAASSGTDRRSGRYGGTELRLLTTPYGPAQGRDESENGSEDDSEDGAVSAGGSATMLYLQAGHDLSLQQEFERQLLGAITVIGLIGLVGSVLVTLFITRRALAPIREAFATERRFVAVASHELRTPVSIIRASAEILERERLVEPDGQALVEDIVGETDRMGRLVGDLLALASAEAGAITIERVPLGLERWFEDIARRSASVAEARGTRLQATVEGGGTSVTVLADSERLDQLVLILVDNAIKHSPPGGAVRLGLVIERRRGLATLSVSDDGPGVDLERRELIFEPFERRAQRNRDDGGAGLGLAIARQLAIRHDAELDVHGDPGEGATFRLRLPLTGDAAGRPVA